MNYRVKDITGLRFARLVILRYSASRHRKAYWIARCDCGREVEVMGGNVIRGNTRSCGCIAEETLAAHAVVHGHARVARKSAEYRTWCDMRTRCNNPRSTFYPAYGAIGITVCQRWDSFAAFLDDMGPKPTPLHSIDRKDNGRGYEPANCRWASRTEQTRNRRCARVVTYDGERMSLLDASERSGISYRVLSSRFHTGWPASRLFEKPRRSPRAISG